MAGYVRQSSLTIQPGVSVDAGPLNDEFNALVIAMNGTVGHVHDGTTGNGPKIVLTAAAGISGILPIANGGTGSSTGIVDGTFTPTIIGTSAAGAGTYSVQTGIYTKIGRVVYFSTTLTWSAHTGTGNMKIGALPFTSVSGHVFPVDFSVSTLALANPLYGRVEAASTTVELGTAALASGAFTALAIDTAATLQCSGFYFV